MGISHHSKPRARESTRSNRHLRAATALGMTLVVGGCTAPLDGEESPQQQVQNSAQPVFTDDFSSGDLSKSNEFFRWGGEMLTGVRLHPVTNDYALRFNYNCAQGGGDANAEQRFVLRTPSKVVALRWREYYATGAEGDNNANPLGYHHQDVSGPDNNKYLRLWGDSYDALDKVGASTRPIGSGPSESLYVETTADGGTGGTGTAVDWVSVPADLGIWREVRMLFRYATSRTAGDGVIKVWRDGVLVIDRNDLSNMHDPASAIQAYQAGYLRGWANSGCTAPGRMRVWYDDFEVYFHDPGW